MSDQQKFIWKGQILHTWAATKVLQHGKNSDIQWCSEKFGHNGKNGIFCTILSSKIAKISKRGPAWPGLPPLTHFYLYLSLRDLKLQLLIAQLDVMIEVWFLDMLLLTLSSARIKQIWRRVCSPKNRRNIMCSGNAVPHSSGSSVSTGVHKWSQHHNFLNTAETQNPFKICWKLDALTVFLFPLCWMKRNVKSGALNFTFLIHLSCILQLPVYELFLASLILLLLKFYLHCWKSRHLSSFALASLLGIPH